MTDREAALQRAMSLLENADREKDLDREFCRALADCFEAELASILEFDPRRGALRFRCSLDLSPEAAAKFEFRLGEGICGAAALTGNTIAAADASLTPQHAGAVDAAARRPTRALLAAPILRVGRCLGVIEILNKREGSFAAGEKLLASALARLYGAVLGKGKETVKKRQGALAPPQALGETSLIGACGAMEQVLRTALKAGASEAPVLILGETGTGKELVARRVHEASPRAGCKMVSINCAALAETLLESELFGHVRGAFTGADRDRKGRLEEADGGTIFLDEIGDMSPACQAKLLRALEQRIAEGAFRADLFFRLRGIEIQLPPLRERAGDVRLLAEVFLSRAAKARGQRLAGFAPAAMELLEAHFWPGNVRELMRAVEGAAALAEGEWIAPGNLPASVRAAARPRPEAKPEAAAPAPPQANFPITAERGAEREHILQALRATAYPGTGRWNLALAARSLGIARKTLEYKVRRVYRLRDGGESEPGR